MDNAKFEFYRGDTYERQITITGWNKEIDSMYFTLKKKETDKEPILQKKLGDGIIKIDSEEDKQKYVLTINATDTDNFKSDTDYVFDIEIISGNIKKTIVKGTLTLKSDITKTINEV